MPLSCRFDASVFLGLFQRLESRSGARSHFSRYRQPATKYFVPFGPFFFSFSLLALFGPARQMSFHRHHLLGIINGQTVNIATPDRGTGSCVELYSNLGVRYAYLVYTWLGHGISVT